MDDDLIVHKDLIDTMLAERRGYSITLMTILDMYLRTWPLMSMLW